MRRVFLTLLFENSSMSIVIPEKLNAISAAVLQCLFLEFVFVVG
jgi:hypothetical protein